MQIEEQADYFERFFAKHMICNDGKRALPDVKARDAEDLGVTLVHLFGGWLMGLDNVRILDRKA